MRTLLVSIALVVITLAPRSGVTQSLELPDIAGPTDPFAEDAGSGWVVASLDTAFLAPGTSGPTGDVSAGDKIFIAPEGEAFGLVEKDSRVTLTGEERDGWEQVSFPSGPFWVKGWMPRNEE